MFDAEALDDIAGANVFVVFERHAAFLTGIGFRNLVLEPLERLEVTLVNDNAVADKPYARATLDLTLGNAATGLGGLINAGAEVGLMLPYQRDQESESDIVGMGYMAKAGYDPRATLYLWKNMTAAQEGRPPEFLSTHPSPDTRMTDLARSMVPALIDYNDARDAGVRPDCFL